MMDFSKSQSTPITATSFFDSDSEEDDFLSVGRGRFSSGFGLRPGRTLNSSFNDDAEVRNHRNGRFDRTSLIAKTNQIIEENEKNILHAVRVASARVTQLDSRTRRLENSMDDLKLCVEYNHSGTDEKLRELESILKEVHMDVKSLLDKQEIAESELRLLKIHHCRTEPKLASPSPHESYSSISVDHQALYSHLVPFTSPESQYTQPFEPYGNPLSYIQQSRQPYDSFAFHSEVLPINSSQALPSALPRASFLESQSGSSGKANKASNEDIVEEVTAMGFRRDRVIAAVRKLAQKQESVDLNTLLDKLMN